MPFVDQSATIPVSLGVQGNGSLLQTSIATLSQLVGLGGNLIEPPVITRARALTSTRIRIDFSDLVDVSGNSPLRSGRFYSVFPLETGIASPVVQRLKLPPGNLVKFVELITSEMTQSGDYGVAINAKALGYEPAEPDWDMELAGVASWIAGGGATLSKQAGNPSGSGAQVLRVVNAGSPGHAAQQVLRVGFLYRLRVWVRGDGSTDARIINGAQVLVSHSSATTAWQFYETHFTATDIEFRMEKLGTGAGWVEFDDAAFQLVKGTSPLLPVTAFPGTAPAVEAAQMAGRGVSPTLTLALAKSPTEVEVTFSEPMMPTPSLVSPATYAFDNGLIVHEVISASENVVVLKTSQQAEGVLYTLSLGPLMDVAFNTIVLPATTLMLGWTTKPEESPALKQLIYLFLMEQLRIEDQTTGNQFLERFLKGPQELWKVITDGILSIPSLWSSEKMPPQALRVAKQIVGWTADLDHITDDLDDDTLRRLIGSAVALWKRRGPEDHILSLLRLLVGARARILNWFDFRWILDETQTGQEFTTGDPWVISEPGGPAADPQTYNLRIVDDGDLNRQLVRNIVKLTRPAGERVDINYLGFLDEFTTPGDDSQWGEESGTVIVVEAGKMRLINAGQQETAYVLDDRAIDWSSYVFIARIRGTGNSWGVVFYRGGDADFYQLMFNPVTNTLSFDAVVGGFLVPITAVNIATWSGGVFGIEENVWYGLQVSITPNTPGSATNRIKVMFDGNLVLDTTDASHVSGGLGARHLSGSTLELDLMEMMFLPATADFIDINS